MQMFTYTNLTMSHPESKDGPVIKKENIKSIKLSNFILHDYYRH
jgi:hypothetical protein